MDNFFIVGKKHLKMNCNQARKISIRVVLESFSLFPSKKNSKTAFYFAIDRKEKTPSLSVNYISNTAFDFGTGKKYDNVSLVQAIKQCSVSEALLYLARFNFSFQKQEFISKTPSIKINEVKPLSNIYLKKYLKSRGLTQISFPFLKEVKFTINQKKLYAIGFENQSGGFELRNNFYKGCTSKDISMVKKSNEKVCVFEGFIDALSYVELNPNFDDSLLVLNSVSLLNKGILELKKFNQINLYLDNDSAGLKTKNEITSIFSNAEDCSNIYKEFKDLNEFLGKK